MQTLDLTFPEYLARDELSVSNLLDLRRSPAFADTREFKDTDAMRLGRVVHCLALEPDQFPKRYVVTDTCAMAKKNGEPCKNPGVKYVDGCWLCGVHSRGLTSDSQLEIVKADEMDLATGAVDGIGREGSGLKGHPHWPTFAAVEASFIGEFEGLPFKVRPDGIEEYDYDSRRIWDLKRVAQPSRIQWEAKRLGWWIRAAIYLEITGGDEYVYACVCASHPFEPWFYRVTDEQRAQGLEEARALAATWKDCTASGVWPGGNAEIEDLPGQPAYVEEDEIITEEDDE